MSENEFKVNTEHCLNTKYCHDCVKFRGNGGSCQMKVAEFNEACDSFDDGVTGRVIDILTGTINNLTVAVGTQIEHIRSQPDSADNKKALMKLHRVGNGLNTIKGILEE